LKNKNKKNEYDTDLDDLIIEILSQEKKISYRDLFNKLIHKNEIISKVRRNNTKPKFKEMTKKLIPNKNENQFTTRLSHQTFTKHLEKLEKDKFIKRSKKIPGKKRYCYLTNIGRRFNWLDKINKSTNKILYKKIFQELFFHEFKKDAIFFDNKEDFLDYLKDINISENEVIWTSRPIETSSNTEIINFLYGPRYYADSGGKYSENWKQFWKKEKNSFILEDFNWISIPIKKEGYPINFYRTEHWQINKDGNHNNCATTYTIELPGIYYNLDTVQNTSHNLTYKTFTKKIEKINFTNEDIKNTIDSFVKYDIVKIIRLGNTQRILISDYRLFKLIDNIIGLLEHEYALLKFHCSLYKKPTKDESKRMDLLLGKDDSNSFFQTLSILRGEEIKIRRNFIEKSRIQNKNIDNCNKKLSKSYAFEDSILSNYLQSISSILDVNSKNYVLNTIYQSNMELALSTTIKKIIRISDQDKNGKEKIRHSETFVLFLRYGDHYLNSYLPKQKKLTDKKIKKLKDRTTNPDPNKRDIENLDITRTLNNLEKEKETLKNYSNINNFVDYMNLVYKYDHFLWYKDILILKKIHQKLFSEYGYIFDKLLYDIFPLLKTATFEETNRIWDKDLQTMLKIGIKDELIDLKEQIQEYKKHTQINEKINSHLLNLKSIDLSNIDESKKAEIRQKIKENATKNNKTFRTV